VFDTTGNVVLGRVDISGGTDGVVLVTGEDITQILFVDGSDASTVTLLGTVDVRSDDEFTIDNIYDNYV
jgi:hypothetical protein